MQRFEAAVPGAPADEQALLATLARGLIRTARPTDQAKCEKAVGKLAVLTGRATNVDTFPQPLGREVVFALIRREQARPDQDARATNRWRIRQRHDLRQPRATLGQVIANLAEACEGRAEQIR